MSTTRLAAIFLDRDGVINTLCSGSAGLRPPYRMDELRLLPGVSSAFQQLAMRGYKLIVVTNQPDIARGAVSALAVDAIHHVLRRRLPLHDIRLCPHDDDDGCDCRKPRPGMLLAAAAEWDVALDRSVMVGDSWKDIVAGTASGCATILVSDCTAEVASCRPTMRAPSLLAAVPAILGHQSWRT